MDFTLEQFLGMFQRYNDAVWPMQVVAYGLGLLVVVLLFSRRRSAGRVVLLILSGLWAWLATVFMLGFQTDISVSGYPFAALFLIGAALLALAALRDDTVLGIGRASLTRTVLGCATIAFALIGYPLVGLASGHVYPQLPLFGVFPCPTAIFTLGVFLCCARPRVYALIVPLVWCFFATMTAIDMGVVQDFGATAAAVLTVIGLVMVRAGRRVDPQPTADWKRGRPSFDRG